MGGRALLCLVVVVLGAAAPAFAQGPYQQVSLAWARQFAGSSSEHLNNGIALDDSGNIYLAGGFNATTDFDPGSSTLNLTPAGDYDVFVAKLDAGGNLLWARRMGGTGLDRAYAIAVDGAGNVYTTGVFHFAADFDPDPGTTFNLDSAAQEDVFVSKLNTNGNFVWAKRFGGTNEEEGLGIALDAAANVHVTGWFIDTADFDPGAGTANLTSAGGRDIFVCKLDTNGNYLARAKFGGTDSTEFGYGIAVDGSGNVFTTGQFSGTSDFDPGAGTQNLSGSNGDAFVSKLDSSLQYVWAGRIGSSGVDRGSAVAVDASGNAIFTGYFSGTVDLDPGAGTNSVTSSGSEDVYLLKLDASGAHLWARRLGGAGTDEGDAIALDNLGNIHVSGQFSNTVDFDPSASSFDQSSTGGLDMWVSKFSPDGAFIWAKKAGSNFTDEGGAIAADGEGSVYVAGNFASTINFDPDNPASQYIFTPANQEDGYVAKWESEISAAGLVNSTGTTDGGAVDREPRVVSDGGGNWIAIWRSESNIDGDGIQDHDILFSRSTDNGVTWSSASLLNTTGTVDGASTDESPSIATDGVGNWIVTWYSTYNLGGAGTDHDIFVSRSSNNGLSWSPAAVLNTTAPSDGSQTDAYPEIATDSAGNWLVVWWSNNLSLDGDAIADWDCYVSRSTDNGVTWSAMALLNSNGVGDAGRSDYFSVIKTDAHGNWVCVWQSDFDLGGNTGNDFDILVSRSSDNGNTWSPSALLNSSGTTDGLSNDVEAEIVTDRAGNWVAVWTSTFNLGGTAGTDNDILVARSSNNGLTWTSPALLASTATTDGASGDLEVVLDTDRAGNWVAMWRSNYNVGGVAGSDYDLLFSKSSDSGANWSNASLFNNTATADGVSDDLSPSLSTDSRGRWLAVWYSSFDSTGTTGADDEILSAGFSIPIAVTVDTLSDVSDGNTTSISALQGSKGADGKISLREAIIASNNTAGGNIINFSVSGTISVSGSQLPALTGGGTAIDGGGTIRIDGVSLGGNEHGIAIASDNNVVDSVSVTRFPEAGVAIVGGSNNKVVGCQLGCNGATALPNEDGVFISNGSGNLVGGLSSSDRNIISGNETNGVQLDANATSNIVAGNYIGINASGASMPNQSHGINISAGASNNVIGGTSTQSRNIIAGNGLAGVFISGAATSGNMIQNNHIGTDVAGSAALPNLADGVLVRSGAHDNIIGPGNVISGNSSSGITIYEAGTDDNVVVGNYIGTNAAGTAAIPNVGGLAIHTTAFGNMVGGDTVEERNVISGNVNGGLSISGSGTTGNAVLGNYIGVNASGTAALPNALRGVLVATSATGNIIGGNLPGQGNVISGNSGPGVHLRDSGTTGNVVLGNYIGTNPAGTAAMANGSDGVRVENAADSDIGGLAAGAGNVISGNTNHGVRIMGASATGVTVQGNFIGLAADGVTALANGADGVNIDTATGATVGGLVAAARNRIGENGNDGVEVNAGTGNAVRQNYIYSNGGDGISLKNGGNTTQPAPVLNAGVNPINGTGEVGAVVDIFADLQDEGRVYLASTNVSGDSSFTSFTDLSSFTGFNLTATQTDASGNTSPFTAPRLIAAVPPAAPSDLRATAGAAQIDLVWNPSTVFNLRGYNLYRRVEGSVEFPKIASLLSAPSYIDTAVVAGTIYEYYVKAVNSTGLESLASNVASARAGNIDLSVPSVPAAPGETARFTLNFVNLTGINPQGIDITISYPLSIRDARPVTVESTATTRNVVPAFSVSSSGGIERIRIVNITTGTTLTGQGSMFEFVVPIAASAPLGCQTLTLSNIALIGPNGPLNATPTNGSICVETGIDCNESRVNGDLDGSGAINVADVLIAHRMVLKLQTSPDCQGSSADLDGDGRVNVRDAQKVHRLTLSKKSLESSAEKASEVNVEVDIVQADIGDIVNVPVYIDDATDLAAAHLTVAFPFNPLKLEFVGITTGALTAAAPAFTYETNSSDNSAQISMSRETGLPGGNGELAVLQFKVLPGAEPGENLPIRLSAVELTDSLSGDFAWSSTVNMEDGAILIAEEPCEGEGCSPDPEPVPASGGAGIGLLLLCLAIAGLLAMARVFNLKQSA